MEEEYESWIREDAKDTFYKYYGKSHISLLKALLNALKDRSNDDKDELYHESYYDSPDKMEIHSQGINGALDRIYRELMNTIFQERLRHIISTMPELPDGYEYAFDYNGYLSTAERQFFEANDLKKFIYKQKKIDLFGDSGLDEVPTYFNENEIEDADIFCHVGSII